MRKTFPFQIIESASMMATRRVFDSMEVNLQEGTDENGVEIVKMITERHGPTITKFEFNNCYSCKFERQDFLRVLSLMPNLREFEVCGWRSDFAASGFRVEKLNLNNLQRLIFDGCEKFMLEILTQALPENVIKSFKVCGNIPDVETLKAFVDKQRMISNLDIDGDFNGSNVFDHLPLTHLRIPVWSGLLRTQPALIGLSCLRYSSVDEAIFMDICKLQQLEQLKMCIDGVPSKVVHNISKLRKLKTFSIKSGCYHGTAFDAFTELSCVQKSSIENLILHPWSFELPAENYQLLGENFKLRSLRIKLFTWHKLNFFMQSFPTLESLNIRFGEANRRVEFSQGYIDDNQKHPNMKHLQLQFWGSEMIDVDVFFKMIESFPNLESLEINAKFPFTSEFLDRIANSLGKIKALDLSSFRVRNNEAFPVETVASLKNLRRKLKYLKLFLRNVQTIRFRGWADVETPDVDDPNCDYKDFSFSYAPLIEALKYDFKAKEFSFSNVRIMNHLYLTAGIEPKHRLKKF